MEENQAIDNESHGRFYWLRVNAAKALKTWIRGHKLKCALGILIVIATLFLLRGFWQPYLIPARKHIYILTVFVPILILFRLALKVRWLTVRIIAILIFLGIVAGMAFPLYKGANPYTYLNLYYRYTTLNLKEIKELPLTAHERIHPKNSIHTLAKEAMGVNESPMLPWLVWDHSLKNGMWSIEIEPPYRFWHQLTDEINAVFYVSSTTTSRDFSDGKIAVSFETGERLALGKDAKTNAIKKLGFKRFLSYEPVDVKYFKNDAGKIVQAVTFIKWEGWLFPYPTFGGVHIVNQSDGSWSEMAKRLIFGVGELIPANEVHKHPYLKGQSIVPYEVSRFMAESYRFDAGPMAPMPWSHKGDVRIPDLPGDLNDLPFTVFFDFEGKGGETKLYDYISLEPFDPSNQGMNTSMLVPGDGIGPIFVCRHYKGNKTLTGFSAIAAKIMASRKTYDWNENRPAENRPYVKDIRGERKTLILTTIVTLKKNKSEYTTDYAPDIAIFNPETNQIVWIKNPAEPDTWVPQLEEELK